MKRRILVLSGSGEDDSKKSRKEHFNRFEKEVLDVLDEFEWRNGDCRRPAVARVSIDVDIDDGKWKKTPCLKKVQKKEDYKGSYEDRMNRLASKSFRLLEDASRQNVTSLDVFWLVSARTIETEVPEILPLIAACRHATSIIANVVIHIIIEPDSETSSKTFPMSWAKHLDATVSRPSDDRTVKNTIESLLKCCRVWRGLLECSSDLLRQSTSSNPSPCRVNISASENVSDRALRVLCRSSSDENLKLSRLRIVRCVSEANMQACFATITMSKSDMLRVTISNEYKQKRTALARFLTSWACESKSSCHALLLEAIVDGGKSVFDRKRVKFREKEYLLLRVHNKNEFIGHVVTHTCLDMNILSVAEMSDDEENTTIETDTLSRLPIFDVSASLWQENQQDEEKDLESMSLQELRDLAKARGVIPEKGHKGRKKTWIDVLSKQHSEETSKLRIQQKILSSEEEEDEEEEDDDNNMPSWARNVLHTEWTYLQHNTNITQKYSRKTSKAEQRLKDATSKNRKRKLLDGTISSQGKKTKSTVRKVEKQQTNKSTDVKPQPSPYDLTSSAMNAIEKINAAERRRQKRLQKSDHISNKDVSWRDLAKRNVVNNEMISRVSLNGMGVHYRHEDEHSSAANSNTERSSFTMTTSSAVSTQKVLMKDNVRRSREGGSYLYTVPPTPVFSPGTRKQLRMQQRQRASAVSDVIASQAERQRKRNESSRTMKMKSKKEMVTKITSRTVSTFQTQSQRRLRLQQKQMYRPTLRRGVPTNRSTTTTTTSSSTSVVSKSVKRQNVERLRERVSNLLTNVLPSRVANDSSYYDKVFRIAYGISIAFLKEEPGGLSGAIMSDEQIATAARHSHYAVKAVVPLYHRFLSDDDDDENEDEEEDDEIMDSLSSSLGGSRTSHSGGIGSSGNMNLGMLLASSDTGATTTMRQGTMLGDFLRQDKDEEDGDDEEVDEDQDDEENQDDRQKRLAQRRAEYLRPNRTAMSSSMMRTPQSTQDYFLG